MKIVLPIDCVNCHPSCSNPAHTAAVDVFYNRIVQALRYAAFKTIERTPSNALKAFW
jgi:hypothetical protein